MRLNDYGLQFYLWEDILWKRHPYKSIYSLRTRELAVGIILPEVAILHNQHQIIRTHTGGAIEFFGADQLVQTTIYEYLFNNVGKKLIQIILDAAARAGPEVDLIMRPILRFQQCV